jgi:ubiquinone biosynthesis protein
MSAISDVIARHEAVPAAAAATSSRVRSRAARRLAVEVILNATVLGVIAAVATMVQVPQPFPFGSASAAILVLGPSPVASVILLGGALTTGEVFLRPVMEAFTGRWLLATMGIVSVAITGVTLWFASSLVQGLGVGYASPSLLWLSVIAVVFSVLTWPIRVAFGLDRALIDHGISIGLGLGLWRALDRIPTPRRNPFLENLRLRQVYDTIASTAIDIGLRQTRLGDLRAAFQDRVLGLPRLPADCRPPRQIRIMLEDLGPTYVKIGQMLATRVDVLRPEWIVELAELQSSATPFAWDDAHAILAADLDRPPETIFKSIESVPFAAASTAQVHRATLFDGSQVVVKVQRPRITARTKADLGVLEQLAKVAEQRFTIARRVGAQDIVAEFAKSVLRELDYRIEAYNARRLADAMARYPEIHIPVVYGDLSAQHVVTQEFIADGIQLSKADELRAAGLDPASLGSVFIRAMVRQILIDGFFHGDPHDGNVLADPATGRLVFLDFGQVGELSRQQRLELLGLIHALKSVDIDGIADSLMALSSRTSEFDERRFRADVDRLAHEYLVYGNAGSLGEALAGILSAVLDNGLRLDGQLTMAIKAVIQAEATARTLAPELDLGQMAITEATAALRESLTPEEIRKRAERSAVHVGKELVRRLPTIESAAFKWFDAFSRGRITVELDTSDLERSFATAGDVGRQATVGVIVVGQLIGTAIVMGTLLQPTLGEYQLFGFLAMAAFGLSLAVSFVVLRRVLRGPAAEQHRR